MDSKEPPFSRQRFKEIVKEVSTYVKKVAYNPDTAVFVPVPGWNGDNCARAKCQHALIGYKVTCEDHNVSGTMLLEALDCILSPTCATDKPLCLSFQDVYEIGGIGTGPVGWVGTGIRAEIMTVEILREVWSEAVPGNSVGFSVKDISVEDVYCDLGDYPEPSRPNQCWLYTCAVQSHTAFIGEGED